VKLSDLTSIRSGTPQTLAVLQRLGARVVAEGEDIRLVDIHERDAAATVPGRWTFLAFSARRLMIVLEPSGSGP
jgi:hypothetical protein